MKVKKVNEDLPWIERFMKLANAMYANDTFNSGKFLTSTPYSMLLPKLCLIHLPIGLIHTKQLYKNNFHNYNFRVPASVRCKVGGKPVQHDVQHENPRV